MWKYVLETYDRLISARKTGMSLDAMFGSAEALASLEREYLWLKQMAKDAGYIEDDSGPRGQYGGHRE
jgi:hypothetical protein